MNDSSSSSDWKTNCNRKWLQLAMVVIVEEEEGEGEDDDDDDDCPSPFALNATTESRFFWWMNAEVCNTRVCRQAGRQTDKQKYCQKYLVVHCTAAAAVNLSAHLRRAIKLTALKGFVRARERERHRPTGSSFFLLCKKLVGNLTVSACTRRGHKKDVVCLSLSPSESPRVEPKIGKRRRRIFP